MAWSGSSGSQTFSRTNGVNTGTTTWQSDDAQSAGITSGRHDTHDQDLSDGISACLKKDGGNTATANLPMGGFKHTNVGDATARASYASFGQVQDGDPVYYPTVAGTVDAITLAGAGAAITAYAAGQSFRFIAAGASTSTTPTVAVDGLTAKTIVQNGGAALNVGDIRSGAMITIEYDGTYFQITGATGATLASGTAMLFVQTAAPTGWTKSTTHNDKTLRVVSGTASSGGSTAFSTIFAARTVAAANLPNMTLTVTDPGHVHSKAAPDSTDSDAGTDNGVITNVWRTVTGVYGDDVDNTASNTTGISVAIDNTARGGGAQTTIDFAVQYVDVIVATKN